MVLAAKGWVGVGKGGKESKEKKEEERKLEGGEERGERGEREKLVRMKAQLVVLFLQKIFFLCNAITSRHHGVFGGDTTTKRLSFWIRRSLSHPTPLLQTLFELITLPNRRGRTVSPPGC